MKAMGALELGIAEDELDGIVKDGGRQALKSSGCGGMWIAR